MPQRGFTDNERDSGRGGGADNSDYRSRQAFDREEASRSHRGNPGRQQAAFGAAEEPGGFSRGPAPAKTETYGGWGRRSSDPPLLLVCRRLLLKFSHRTISSLVGRSGNICELCLTSL